MSTDQYSTYCHRHHVDTTDSTTLSTVQYILSPVPLESTGQCFLSQAPRRDYYIPVNIVTDIKYSATYHYKYIYHRYHVETTGQPYCHTGTV